MKSISFDKNAFYKSLFFLIPLIYFLSLPSSVGDLAVWIAHGLYFLDTGQILRQDIYSVLPTSELIYPVATSILYAFIYKMGQLDSVVVFHKLVVLGICIFWYKSSFSNLNSPWTLRNILFVLFTWVGTSLLCIERPALVAMVPFVASYLILQKNEDLQLSDIILLNVINIFWVNIHGSWLILGMLYFYREFSRILFLKQKISLKPILGLLAVAVTSLMNPFGYKIIPYVLETARVSKERGITEWDLISFSEHTLQATVYLCLILGFFYLAFYLKKNRPEKVKSLWSSPFVPILFLGIIGMRNTLWPFFVLLPFCFQFGILSEGVTEKLQPNKFKLILNFAIISALVLISISLLPLYKNNFSAFLPSSKKAVYDESAPFLFSKILNETTDRYPVFNDWEYGSFLILAQSHPIFIDTRNIIYSKEGFDVYQQVVQGQPGWESILEKYKIRYLILNRKLRSRLISQIDLKQNWKKLKENEDTVLYYLAASM